MELNNKLICDFMQNYTYQSDSGVNWIEINGYPFAEFNDAPFHLSYDWLMPVVEKVENIVLHTGLKDGVSAFTVSISGYWCEIDMNTQYGMAFPEIEYDVIECSAETKLEATYKAVVEFIKWYNKNKDGNTVA